jgi:hypothetical protein
MTSRAPIRRFDEFIEAFRPTQFDFQGENRRSPGTQITDFPDDMIDGVFNAAAYNDYERSWGRPRTLHLGHDASRLRRHWLHGLSSEGKACIASRLIHNHQV